MFTVAEYRWKKHGDRLGAIELLAKGTSKEEVPPQLLVNAAVLLAENWTTNPLPCHCSIA